MHVSKPYRCPKCGSEDVCSRPNRSDWLCLSCQHVWVSIPDVFQDGPPGNLRIFLSYGHDVYTPQALRIKHDLEARGHEVWYDAERLHEGRDWEQYIEQGLSSCDKVVLLMTPYSVRRRVPGDNSTSDGYCLNEIAKALERNKLIIPVLLAFLDQGPPVSICRIQYLDLRDIVPIDEHEQSYSPRFERLIRAVEHNELNFEGGQARLQRLLRPIDFDLQIGRHLSKFRGRQWLIDELNAWLKDAGESRVFWLVGPPGVGKSAFAASLRHRGDVGAFHFCVHGNDDKGDPRRAVLSLAYQLSQRLPEYEQRLQRLGLEDDVARNATTLFEKLIVEPLTKEFSAPKHDLLIVIDGIDEATRDGRNEIAEFVAMHWPQTPHWLKLVLTSRAEEVIKTPLKRLALQPRIINADSAANRNDIREYLSMEIFASGPQMSADTIDELTERTEGIFLFAQVLVQEFREGHLSLTDLSAVPAGLGDYYRRFFNRQFPDRGLYESEIWPLLCVVAAQREPLSLGMLAAATGLSVFHVRRRLGSLGALLVTRGSGGEADTVAPFHKSLLEWLGDVDPELGTYKAGPFAISLEDGNRMLARQCNREYGDAGPNAMPYVLRHLLAHSCAAREWKTVESLLQDNDFCRLRIVESGLAVAAREWAEAATAVMTMVVRSTETRIKLALAFTTPLLPAIIYVLESNTTGVCGPAAPESEPICRLLEPATNARVAELFRMIAPFIEPSPFINEVPEVRCAMCAIQLFAEIGDCQREIGVARELVGIYPKVFKILHFAAIAARHLALANHVHREQYLTEAIDLEARAQALPDAKADSYYALSFSTIGKIQLGLAKYYRFFGHAGRTGPLLNQALANIERRLQSGQSPMALTYYCEVLEELERSNEAYFLAREICENIDGFVGDAQSIILRLAQTQAWQPRYEAPVLRHARHWIVTHSISGQSDRIDLAVGAQTMDNYFRFLLDEGLEPEAVERFSEERSLNESDLTNRCQTAARASRAVSVRIGDSVVECDVLVWEFKEPKPHVVVGLPTISIFGSGETILIALEYLRALLVILEQAISRGQWVAWRPANVQLIARWLENHRRRGTSPPPLVGEMLRESERLYHHGEFEQVLPRLVWLEENREFFNMAQLHSYLRMSAWIAGRRGDVQCMKGLEQLSRLNRTDVALLTDYVSTLVFAQYVPDERIDPWLELGQSVFEDGGSRSGWRSHFFEHYGATKIARGDSAGAIVLLREALQDECECQNELRIVARIQARLAEALRQQSMLPEAEELLASSLAIQREHGFQADLVDLTVPTLAKLQPASVESFSLLADAQAISRRIGALKSLGKLLLIEARMTPDVARAAEIRRTIIAMQTNVPVLNEQPVPQVISNWDQWSGAGIEPCGDYWGL